MFKPEIVVIDFETSSLEFYSPDFQVKSAALAFTGKDGNVVTKFSNKLEEVRDFIRQISANNIPVAVYNAGFEAGIFKCVYPEYPINITVDVMRLVQVFDNGAVHDDFISPFRDEFDYEFETRADGSEVIPDGLGLKSAGPRILGKSFVKAETRAYQWLADNLKISVRQARSHLGELPEVELKLYNEADVINTLNLYTHLTRYFNEIDYNWKHDHALYLNSVNLVTEAKIRGIKVDQEALSTYISTIEAEISTIEKSFRLRFMMEITDLEEDYWNEEKALRKTDKGKEGVKRPTFNMGSNQQLADLFTKKLGKPIVFWTSPKTNPKTGKTPKPSPSFKRAHLASWGEGGEILLRRRQRMIVLSQCKSLLKLAERDGYWHPHIKIAGTATGRLTSGAE